MPAVARCLCLDVFRRSKQKVSLLVQTHKNLISVNKNLVQKTNFISVSIQVL